MHNEHKKERLSVDQKLWRISGKKKRKLLRGHRKRKITPNYRSWRTVRKSGGSTLNKGGYGVTGARGQITDGFLQRLSPHNTFRGPAVFIQQDREVRVERAMLMGLAWEEVLGPKTRLWRISPVHILLRAGPPCVLTDEVTAVRLSPGSFMPHQW